MAAKSSYSLDILLEGFPGRTAARGSLGWSTVALLRGQGRVALIDVGSFCDRAALRDRLGDHGIGLGDVTDVLLTHAHYDHMLNWTLFPGARVVIGAQELDWAVGAAGEGGVVPEFHVAALRDLPALVPAGEGDEVLPGLVARHCPGHTPGHLVFVADAGDHDLIFTGDAVKNRAELLSREVMSSHDPTSAAASIDRVWDLWRARPGSVLVPGHDLPLVADGEGCRYRDARRTSGVLAWFGDDLSATTAFDLRERQAGPHDPR